jgi:transcriptional regulator with XRE-family HTH domain
VTVIPQASAAVVAIDRLRSDPDNEAMVHRRAAKRVIAWRKEHALNQVEFAAFAKVSVGCLQGFETGTRNTRETNLIKIATAVGLTTEALLHDDDPMTTPNPLLAGLRDIDFQHAQHFHHASPHAKAAAFDWLGPKVSDELRERIAAVVERLLTMDADLFATVERFVLADDGQQQTLLPLGKTRQGP